MKNIVFDCERMKYEHSGLFHFCYQLGNHIHQNIDSSEENITYFSPPSSAPLWQNSNRILQNSFQKFWMPSLNRFDVWHATYQSSNYLPKRNKRIKVVLTIHDLNFLYEGKNPQKAAKHLKHLQENIDRSDAIVCISEFCKKDVLNHCKTGDKPVYMIHNGNNHLTSPQLDVKSYRPKRPFLFSLGAICRKKNFHVLVPLLKFNRDLELLIAGTTQDRSYLNDIWSLARRLRVDENLRLLGNINESEKSWYYQNCYAFAFPSIAEGFGLPVAEAMSVGKPVFISDRTSLPEIGSTAAFYFSDFSEDHMQNVFENGMQDYTRKNMEGVIKERGNSFCWNKAAKQYIEVYRSL
jgi:glycosyltransferase involved in cell wall biosynthesis